MAKCPHCRKKLTHLRNICVIYRNALSHGTLMLMENMKTRVR